MVLQSWVNRTQSECVVLDAEIASAILSMWVPLQCGVSKKIYVNTRLGGFSRFCTFTLRQQSFEVQKREKGGAEVPIRARSEREWVGEPGPRALRSRTRGFAYSLHSAAAEF